MPKLFDNEKKFNNREHCIKYLCENERNNLKYIKEYDDERISGERYYLSIYGSLSPTDEQIRQVIIAKLSESEKNAMKSRL